MFLQKLSCLKWNSRTVQKSPYCELVQIAPTFVNYYRYSLRGVNLVPLRPLEKISDPQKGSLKQCYETTFFRQYFADLLETFGIKKLF